VTLEARRQLVIADEKIKVIDDTSDEDLTRSVRLQVICEQDQFGSPVRVGSIAPGFTHTEILAAMRPEVLEKLTAPVPLKRLG
jgi:hypothetical protein